MGLGFQSISRLNAVPYFSTLINQGTVTDEVFAFYLADSGSEIHLGWTDSTKYTVSAYWASNE